MTLLKKIILIFTKINAMINLKRINKNNDRVATKSEMIKRYTDQGIDLVKLDSELSTLQKTYADNFIRKTS